VLLLLLGCEADIGIAMMLCLVDDKVQMEKTELQSPNPSLGAIAQ
jgi:hypothetical protein